MKISVRRRPDHHDAVDLLLVAEAVDVLADRLEHRPLADAALDVVGVDVLDVRAVERGRHRADVAQRVGDLLDVLAGVEHPGALGGDVGVVGERVPRAEHDVVELGDRGEVLDQRAAVVGALAEADRVHQGQRADRLGQAPLHQLDAGDEGGGDGAEADGEDAEAPVGRLHGRGRMESSRAARLGVVADPVRAVRVHLVTAIVMDGNGPARRAARGPAPSGSRPPARPPICLATVLVGDDPPSQRYVRSKQRKATEIGHAAAPRRPAGDVVAGPGRGGGRRAGGRSGRPRDPRPAAAARRPRPRAVHRPDPAGEGRRRAHRALDGPPRARRRRASSAARRSA